jgi:2',3'-cyclic-nucleotide 2'-phosphodiesterase (5'-nucleotidase family)
LDEPVVISATSDLHACLADDPARGRIGAARLKAYLDELRRSARAVFHLDAGDVFSGHVFGAIDGGRTVARALGRLGCRTLTPGNHDFDFSRDENDPLHYVHALVPLVREQAGGPLDVLACNLRWRGGPFPQNVEGPLTLFEEDGFRVRAVGVACPYSSRPSLAPYIDGCEFEAAEGPDEAPATRARLLEGLERRLAAGARPGDAVVVMSHLGEFGARQGRVTGFDLARLSGVALVVDGHSHRRRGPLQVGRAWYLNCGEGLTAVAEARLRPGRPFVPRLLTYGDLAHVRPDPDLQALTDELTARLELAKPLARLPGAFDRRPGGRLGAGSPLSRLICRALAAAVGADLAFLNQGALRGGLAGLVTVGDVHEALPFRDEAVSGLLEGEEIWELLVRLGRKGPLGLPFHWGVDVYGRAGGVGERPDDRPSQGLGRRQDDGPENEPLELAGLIDAAGRDLRAGGRRRAVFSRQLAETLALGGLPGRREHGLLASAVMDGLTRLSAQELALVERPNLRLFEDLAAARRAWRADLQGRGA